VCFPSTFKMSTLLLFLYHWIWKSISSMKVPCLTNSTFFPFFLAAASSVARALVVRARDPKPISIRQPETDVTDTPLDPNWRGGDTGLPHADNERLVCDSGSFVVTWSLSTSVWNSGHPDMHELALKVQIFKDWVHRATRNSLSCCLVDQEIESIQFNRKDRGLILIAN
jgi:hypothetical protein